MISVSMLTAQLPSLQSPDFRRLFFSTFFTAASRWALMLARSWLVFDLTGSSLAVGVVFFAGSIQFVIVGPVAGAFADRIDRRSLVLVSLWISVICCTVLAGLTIAGVVEVWQIVLLAVIQGWATALSMPALRAMIPNLVPSDHLLNAIALTGISQHGSRLAGPLFGGVLLVVLGGGMQGAGLVFALSAGVLLLALGQMWRIEYRFSRIPEDTVSNDDQISAGALMRDITAGFAHVWNDTRLRLVTALVVPHCALTMSFNSMLPRLATDVGGGSDTFTAIMIALGVGAIGGTLGIAIVKSEVVQGYTLVLTAIISGLSMVVLGLATTQSVAIVGALLAGSSQATYMVISQTLVQQIAPDAMRGRVMSILVVMAAGHMAFVNLGTGALADVMAVRLLMVVPAVLWIIVFFIAVLVLSEFRHVLRYGVFRSRLDAVAAAGDR